MRKIIVYIATSTDGFIARKDHGIDWLDRPHPKGSYGMNAFFRSIDTILWGRKTLDVGLKMGGNLQMFGPRVKNYAFSRNPPKKPIAGVEFVTEPIAEFVARLRAQPGKDIWMMGGGDIIASFLDAGAIDEFVITMVPVFIGDGIPLIARGHRHLPLALMSTQSFEDGVVQLHYSVPRHS